MSSSKWESAAELIGSDGLCGVMLPDYSCVPLIAPPESERVERLAEQIRRIAPVRYVVTGPCTNLAELCDHFGSNIKKYISSVSIMGGALAVPGNSGPRDANTGRQLAEFNFYCDPFAVNVVLRSGLPIYMVPWDTTHRLTIPASKARSLKVHNDSTRFISGLMDRFFTLYGLKLNREFEFNDPAAVWLPLAAPDQFKERRVEAVTAADGFGRLVEHPDGSSVFFHSCRSEEADTIVNELLVKLHLL
jgi:inosine-uridine nucleoside N-ribohydrolase